jgi:hypothetical protein
MHINQLIPLVHSMVILVCSILLHFLHCADTLWFSCLVNDADFGFQMICM